MIDNIKLHNNIITYIRAYNPDYDEILHKNYIFNKHIYIKNHLAKINGKNIRLSGKLYDKKNGNELIYFFDEQTNEFLLKEKEYTWHTKWQSHFKNIEVKYLLNKQITNSNHAYRISDIDLSYDYIIEIQNSYMKMDEVKLRKEDWKYNNKKIIWILNGNIKRVNIHKLSDKRILLEFNDDWLINNYKNSYNYICYDIEDNIYIINPNNIKSRMIEIKSYIQKDKFIEIIKSYEETNKDIEKEFILPLLEKNNDILSQTSKILVKQYGAGNGKTYSAITLLNNPSIKYTVNKQEKELDISNIETFIYLTKMHSAKVVIKEEFETLISNGTLKAFKKIKEDDVSKKYIYEIEYNNHNKKICKIIIATIDSFMYSLGNNINNVPEKNINKFMKILKDVIDENNKLNSNIIDGFSYFGKGIKLNMKTLIIGDEMQDLHEDYGKALIRILREYYLSMIIVGDKLQSIQYEANTYTFLNGEFSNIDLIKFEKQHICRRTNYKSHKDFVNHMIPHKLYELPEMSVYNEINDNNKQLQLINKYNKYNTITNYNKLENYTKEQLLTLEIETLMSYYIYEAETNNRNPNDFLIVTPFVKSNSVIDMLNSEIQEYWHNKYKNNNNTNQQTYTRYSVLHKSETGSCINLNESKNATRIVSIHSSKGDGRKVVFTIGITESALKVFAKRSKQTYDNKNLIFDSLLNVSITRQKEILYFFYDIKNDYIYKKIVEYKRDNDIKYLPRFRANTYISISSLTNINNDNIDKFYNYYRNNIYLNKIYENKDDKQLLDLSHHNIRYICMYILFSINILKYENYSCNQPIFQILYKIAHYSSIIEFNNLRNYYGQLRIEYENRMTNKHRNIPILKYDDENNDYYDNYMFVKRKIEEIKDKLILMFSKKKIDKPLTYIESVILYYLMEIYDNQYYSKIYIDELYDIINIFRNSSKQKKSDYRKSHYKKLEYVDEICNKFNAEYGNMKYLFNHPIFLPSNENSNTYSDYKLYKNLDIIAYNNENIVICKLYPQFNEINYDKIIYESLINAYILLYQKKNNDFKNKNIVTAIFTFDNNCEPYYIKWNINFLMDNKDKFSNLLVELLINYYEFTNIDLYMLYKYYYELCIENNKLDKLIYYIYEYIERKNKIKNIKSPIYIDRFLSQLEDEVYNLYESDDSDEILKYYKSLYDNKENFKKKINNKLVKTISNYIKLLNA